MLSAINHVSNKMNVGLNNFHFHILNEVNSVQHSIDQNNNGKVLRAISTVLIPYLELNYSLATKAILRQKFVKHSDGKIRRVFGVFDEQNYTDLENFYSNILKNSDDTTFYERLKMGVLAFRPPSLYRTNKMILSNELRIPFSKESMVALMIYSLFANNPYDAIFSLIQGKEHLFKSYLDKNFIDADIFGLQGAERPDFSDSAFAVFPGLQYFFHNWSESGLVQWLKIEKLPDIDTKLAKIKNYQISKRAKYQQLLLDLAVIAEENQNISAVNSPTIQSYVKQLNDFYTESGLFELFEFWEKTIFEKLKK